MAVIHVLRSGYNVLLTDVDVVFFKNPFDFFTCLGCDIHIQREDRSSRSHERNSGFMFDSWFAFILVMFEIHLVVDPFSI